MQQAKDEDTKRRERMREVRELQRRQQEERRRIAAQVEGHVESQNVIVSLS